MKDKTNEIFVVWEITSLYPFSTVYFTEEEARRHLDLRSKTLFNEDCPEDLKGRELFVKRYINE